MGAEAGGESECILPLCLWIFKLNTILQDVMKSEDEIFVFSFGSVSVFGPHFTAAAVVLGLQTDYTVTRIHILNRQDKALT